MGVSTLLSGTSKCHGNVILWYLNNEPQHIAVRTVNIHQLLPGLIMKSISTFPLWSTRVLSFSAHLTASSCTIILSKQWVTNTFNKCKRDINEHVHSYEKPASVRVKFYPMGPWNSIRYSVHPPLSLMTEQIFPRRPAAISRSADHVDSEWVRGHRYKLVSGDNSTCHTRDIDAGCQLTQGVNWFSYNTLCKRLPNEI